MDVTSTRGFTFSSYIPVVAGRFSRFLILAFAVNDLVALLIEIKHSVKLGEAGGFGFEFIPDYNLVCLDRIETVMYN